MHSSIPPRDPDNCRSVALIHDHMNIWLLRPGVGGFGNLPMLLDDTDERSGAEQLGDLWELIEGHWGFRRYGRDSNSKLWNGGQNFELLGAIYSGRERARVDLRGRARRDRSVGSVV